MVVGGRRAGDKKLKERRKAKKKFAENRLQALGEALGHVDDEDGVLLKVGILIYSGDFLLIYNFALLFRFMMIFKKS